MGGGPFGGGSSEQPAVDVAAEIVAQGGQAIPNFGDVSSERDAQALIDDAVSQFGRIDIVINNAGISRFAPFSTIPRSELDAMLSVHVGGSWGVTSAAWPYMTEQGYGRVLMTSSHNAIGLEQSAHYAAAKGAILGLMRVLSLEGESVGINVNAIMPGATTRLLAAASETAEGEVGPETPTLPADLVAPVAAWLVHETCQTRGEILAAAAGYVGRLFIAQTNGLVDPALTIEAVRDSWSQVVDETGYTVATSVEAIVGLLTQGVAVGD